MQIGLPKVPSRKVLTAPPDALQQRFSASSRNRLFWCGMRMRLVSVAIHAQEEGKDAVNLVEIVRKWDVMLPRLDPLAEEFLVHRRLDDGPSALQQGSKTRRIGQTVQIQQQLVLSHSLDSVPVCEAVVAVPGSLTLCLWTTVPDICEGDIHDFLIQCGRVQLHQLDE